MTPLDLTRRLLAFNTINPPGDEDACVRYAGSLLERAGFVTRYSAFAPRRTSLIATLSGNGSPRSLCFTGHLDTVPLGAAPWTRDPFGADVSGDLVYGRGASDMKAAVAAMLVMAERASRWPDRVADLTLILTAGEETACQGARHLAETEAALPEAGALVVGEPTGNAPWVAHKGCVRYHLTVRGTSADASMPEHGDNAIHKAAGVVAALRGLDFGLPRHALLGAPTLNIGTIEGGTNINSVPDRARIGIDVRLLPGQTEASVHSLLHSVCGAEVEIERIEGAGSVETDSSNPWIREVFELVQSVTGTYSVPRGAPYFTDASVLTPALRHPPTVILGPGEPDQAHRTDEYCHVSKLEQATELYTSIARQWCIHP